MRRAFFFIGLLLFASASFASIPRASALNPAPPIADALAETRVRAFEVLAPFEQPAESELTRALRRGYGDSTRTYASGLGRFLSVDPKERRRATSEPQEWNRYAYARNNPVNLVDPDGRDALWFKDQGSGRAVLVIPVQFSGTGATPAKIAAITRRLQNVNTGGTGVSIVLISTDKPVHGVLNRVNLSPNYDFQNFPSAGEGVNSIGGTTAHINTAASNSTGAAAHEILHFAGVTDKYQEGPRDANGNRTSQPLPGYGSDNIMTDRAGTNLKPEQIKEAEQNPTTKDCTVGAGTTRCQ